MEAAKRKLLTLAFVVDRRVKPHRILLGRKKTGFGTGYFNGFGGKVEVGETVMQAAHRELQEEAKIEVKDLKHTGVIYFDFYDPPLVPMQVHVFVASQYEGEPTETSEMAPEWFDLDKIPFEKMWQDDPLWFPSMLGDRPFVGRFLFHNTHTMETTNIEHVETHANLPEMPPVDSKTHSRHRPPANAAEAAAAGKWYEQKQPPVSSTTDGETLDADSSADAAEKADAETTETATESEAAPTENGAAASQSAQDPQDPQATAASN